MTGESEITTLRAYFIFDWNDTVPDRTDTF